jgi:hypothetical protein
MRDLLFRVFDLQEKVMSEIISLKDIALSGGIDFNGKDGWYGYKWEVLFDYNPDRFIIMQYTGLKDKDGKMIFEGDIVNYLGEGLFLIDIGELGFFRHLNDESGDMDIIPDRLLERSSSFEILGNVHLHKHLLDSSLEDK